MQGLLVWAAVFLMLAAAGCIWLPGEPADDPVPTVLVTPATPVVADGATVPVPLITPGPDARPDPRQHLPSCEGWDCSTNCSEFPQTPSDWHCWYCQDKVCQAGS